MFRTATVVNPAGGAIRVWAADQAQPDGAMGPRYLTGQNRSVASVVPVSADGRIKIQASAGTDVVVYTQGWFAEPEPGRDGVFNPLN